MYRGFLRSANRLGLSVALIATAGIGCRQGPVDPDANAMVSNADLEFTGASADNLSRKPERSGRDREAGGSREATD